MAGTASEDPFVVCWRDLDDITATEELDRLTEWVGWFTSRYRLDHKLVPPCWHHHGALTEELSALRSSGRPATWTTPLRPTLSRSIAT
jgi:hypothetical protein